MVVAPGAAALVYRRLISRGFNAQHRYDAVIHRGTMAHAVAFGARGLNISDQRQGRPQGIWYGMKRTLDNGAVLIDILGRSTQRRRIITEVTQSYVAPLTQQLTLDTRRMTVISGEPTGASLRLLADGTHTALRR